MSSKNAFLIAWIFWNLGIGGIIFVPILYLCLVKWPLRAAKLGLLLWFLLLVLAYPWF